ncbi:PTS sugar transporter subunit IIA [Peribacillus loiseleuriae]|uniref:PTS EIIA type-2 domain-containing protein n=1 Tax=Peribacillus loiseleuriae TaxID=1679170 RepID=A0A0K9GUQ5_9BACI|nr:PTS sugar transporter subunit IIA [Peribacillus loiseleuriae]KMY49972.1 hypothetical protein AC625_10975 [Peribacillus loiseleuriae]
MEKDILLDEKLIITNLRATEQQDVLKSLFSKLHKEGCVRDSFLENILKREENFPTGLKLGKYNIAIPHTEPQFVNKSALAVTTLEKPVNFRRMDKPEEEVPVDIVIMLALKEKNDHLKVLGKIIQMFQSSQVLESLKKANNSKEIIEIIKSNL